MSQVWSGVRFMVYEVGSPPFFWCAIRVVDGIKAYISGNCSKSEYLRTTTIILSNKYINRLKSENYLIMPQ